jgi:hypothetical protein
MDFTDLPTVKAWLGLPAAAGSNDDLILALITAVSAFICDYLNSALISASYVETYDGTGASWMLLRQAPITAVQSVAFRGQTITAAGDPVAGTPGILFDGRRLTLLGQRFPHRALVVVSYTAGYAVTPPAVGQAALELAGEAFRRRDHIAQTSKSLGGQETVAFSPADMNATIKTLLAPYRAVAPV